MATSTTSASSVLASPPAAGSTVTLAAPLAVSTLVTLEPSMNLTPCFSRMRWNCLTVSTSMPGRMRSRYSTTVTSAPRRRQTEPSSRPITPAPTTIIFAGTLDSSSAPVEETTIFSSMVTPGSGATSEPVAMTTFLVSRTCFEPSSAVTSTLPAATIEPVPKKASTLFFLSRKATPCTLAPTVSSLCFIIAARSSLGLPTTTPSAPTSWATSSNTSEACSSALEGMQPMLRQVPPWVLRFSTTAVFRPSWAARMAQT